VEDVAKDFRTKPKKFFMNRKEPSSEEELATMKEFFLFSAYSKQ
jgi:hypothetical protein